jgi:hypothetical protein
MGWRLKVGSFRVGVHVSEDPSIWRLKSEPFADLDD